MRRTVRTTGFGRAARPDYRPALKPVHVPVPVPVPDITKDFSGF